MQSKPLKTKKALLEIKNIIPPNIKDLQLWLDKSFDLENKVNLLEDNANRQNNKKIIRKLRDVEIISEV